MHLNPAVTYRSSGRVAVMTINRPERRNAVNEDVVAGMTAALEAFEADPEVWVAIVTGAGEVAFCAGADLETLSRGGSIWSEQGGFAGFVRYPTSKPVIAAVNGLAMGGGFEIVLACDLVIAADHASFALPEVSRGIVAAGGGLFRLPRRIPPALAAELILTGERLPAARAAALGLINALVPAARLMESARALADRICANAPLAVRESVALLRQAAALDDARAWQLSAAARERLLASADFGEGARAFLEKRSPSWSGR
ncbi:MAG: crotonase/enoyl-CoA hydratase family protein [Candidatus Dormibacteria bacterium]